MNDWKLGSAVHPESSLQNGNFSFPDTVRFIRIDVGLSGSAVHSAWFLDLYEDRGSIGIEPDPRCCDIILNGLDLHPETKRIVLNRQAIEYNNHPVRNLDSRFVLVSCAISDVSGPRQVPFYLTDAQPVGRYQVHGTSSLHEPTQAHPSGGYYIQEITAIPLSEIIKAIPDRFEFIEEIKVDTEGHDFQVLQSAGDLIKRAVYVTVESGNMAPLYHSGVIVSGNSTRPVIKEYLTGMGFKVDFEDGDDQRYLNVRLKHLVKRYGLNTNGHPNILPGRRSWRKRIKFKIRQVFNVAG